YKINDENVHIPEYNTIGTLECMQRGKRPGITGYYFPKENQNILPKSVSPVIFLQLACHPPGDPPLIALEDPIPAAQ
ncbi:hypothetical protein BgiBS90_026385, partial [Biomphalaria glabrata]